MKSFRIPLFKKIIGALTKSFSNDDVAIVPREDGIYVAYKQDGSLVERKIYDERHNAEIAGMATGLGENIGSIRRTFLPGDALRAEELASISSGEPTVGYVEASTPAEPYSTFAGIRDGLDNGAISFVHNGTEYNNIAISLQPKKFSEQNIVNHTNYAGTSNATTSRGMTIIMGNLSKDQLVVKSLRIYLIAGETYTVKLYRNEGMVDLMQEKTIVATQTKFHDVILDDEYLFENGDAITVIVEGANFDYFYPSGTPAYTKSWADGSADGVFDITNTLPIKLVVWPAIGLNDEYEDITPVINLIQEKITEETGVEVFRDNNADLWKFYFNAGFIQFDTASSSGSDLFSLLGFGSGRTTVYGEGYNAEDSPGKIVRVSDDKKIPLTRKTVRLFQINANATHTISCGFRPSIITAVSTSNYSSGGTSVGRYENGEQGSFGQHSSTVISSSTEILKTSSMNAVISNITDDGFDITFVASSYYNNVILTIFE